METRELYIRHSCRAAKMRASAIVALLVFVASAAVAQTYTVLHDFNPKSGTDGGTPFGQLTKDAAGNIYGTTIAGGAFDVGTVFKIAPNGTRSILHDFSGGPDGWSPMAGVTLDSAGNLYGTTFNGGLYNVGTVFKIDTAGGEVVLHSFGNGTDGAGPEAGVLIDTAGNLYGTTNYGGGFNLGTVFRIDPDGTERLLHEFSGADGSRPAGALARNSTGVLYGITQIGGSSDCGTVYMLDRTNVESVLYNFACAADGFSPNGEVTLDRAGNLYGVTLFGGKFSRGTVFKIDINGTKSTLHSFAGRDGSEPFSSLVLDSSGNLYGTTVGGGAFFKGTVFKLDPNGKETVLHNFNVGAGGFSPESKLLLAARGTIYGTTPHGGNHDAGVLFRLQP